MKKNSIISFVFVILLICVIAYGGIFVYRRFSRESATFKNDGYSVIIDDKSIKSKALSFKSGATYTYNKFNNIISYTSLEKEKAKLDNSSLLHFEDKSLMVLKNAVGINLDLIDSPIIFYYNIFKNTEINYKDNKYSIKSANEDEISFDELLLRINDNKYFLAGNNIRCLLGEDEIIDFGDYVYFEYSNGSVVKIYNNEKYYQTISENASLLVDKITISLTDRSVSKEAKKYITLSNLVIDMDNNIDLLPVEEEKKEKADINESKVSDDVLNGGDSDGSSVNNSSVGNVDDGTISEEEEDNSDIKDPIYKVVSLSVTPMKFESSFEIEDKSSLLTSPTSIKIVENKTAKVVYEAETEEGDLFGNVSYPDLKPDTEYTFLASASYKKDDVEYEKSFISKIFRTEALGVEFNKSYVTNNSIVLNLKKENYSKVSSVTVGIFDTNGNQIDYKLIDFNKINNNEITFSGLDNNKTYVVKMYDIICSGIIVDDGFSQRENISTLKTAPTIGTLTYQVDKANSQFNLDITKVTDPDYGIVNYRYEIFDVRQNMNTDTPIVSLNSTNLGTVVAKVDDLKLYHGVAYTYRVVAEFFDNEKTVEYISSLGKTMQIDGVTFPTLRFAESNVTWEQINGTIIIDDPSGTIVSNKYKIVYKNSIDVYNTIQITADTSRLSIPISINYLRANETYTFDVYASINLQDGNDTVDEAYIGNVKVQTKKPNSFTASFIMTDSLTDVFSINFRLADNNGSSAFEASTLSSLSFTLYQGSTTNGRVEVYKRTIDSIDDEYISSLKSDFYDKVTAINAGFFNGENSDFKQKSYTLVVDGAYDYTGINEIPIKNNEYHFERSNYIPDLPGDGAQILTNSILNKNASYFGLDYNENLNPDTVVGYSVSANYDNTTKSGKYIIYHVHVFNPDTGEFEEIPALDKRVNFLEDGSLPLTVFSLDSGTSFSTKDRDLMRRGNQYYFSYDAYLDIDGDDDVDTIYPASIDSNVQLKSENVSPKKQLPTILLYPSQSTNTTFKWKYKISDIDNTMDENKLYGFVNANTIPSSADAINVGGSDYLDVNFTNLQKGNVFTIKTKDRRLKHEDFSYNTITSQYFYGYMNKLDLTYKASLSSNKILLTINDYMSKRELIDSIAYGEAKIIPTHDDDLQRLGTKTISNLKIVDGEVSINLYDVESYLNCEFQIDLYAYYDTGGTGFDYQSNYKAIQKGTYDEIGNYYSLNNGNMVQTPSIYKNIFETVFDLGNKTLKITNFNNKSYSMVIRNDNTGIIFENNNILLKEIKSEKLDSDQNVLKFEVIIPSVSILDSNNKVNITPLLTTALIDAKIYNASSSLIEDNSIFIELYSSDANGANVNYVDSIKKPISAFNGQVELTNLLPQTNYFIKFYANIYNTQTNNYEKTYLYDIDQNEAGLNYRFNTLADVGISNLTTQMVSNSYSDKKLLINYNLENVSGYERIEYRLYKKVNGVYNETGIIIPNSEVFFNAMQVALPITLNEENQIQYGSEYMINITPIANYVENGVSRELDLGSKSIEFRTDDYVEPYIGISGGKSSTSIYFRVSIVDDSYLIVDGKYSVKLVNKDGAVIASQNNLSINDINKKFVYNYADYNLEDLTTYNFIVSAQVDYHLLHSNYDVIEKNKSVKTGSIINLGTVVLSKGEQDSNSIDVIFSDSYQLNKIDTIVYTIVSANSGYYFSNKADFITRYDSARDLYYYTIDLDDSFVDNMVYIVDLNFYSNNELVGNMELDYYAGGNDA